MTFLFLFSSFYTKREKIIHYFFQLMKKKSSVIPNICLCDTPLPKNDQLLLISYLKLKGDKDHSLSQGWFSVFLQVKCCIVKYFTNILSHISSLPHISTSAIFIVWKSMVPKYLQVYLKFYKWNNYCMFKEYF